MKKLICEKCMAVFQQAETHVCGGCGDTCYDFSNDDAFLLAEAPKVIAQRKADGLEGLVGGLECVIINTEPDRQIAAVGELLRFTGMELDDAFEDDELVTFVLKAAGSADFLVRSRKNDNPFPSTANYPKAAHLPNTRLETLVFSVSDMERYVTIQRGRGVEFLTDEPVVGDNHLFIQTIPSSFTDISIGFIQQLAPGLDYRNASSRPVAADLASPGEPSLANVKELDHAAVRVEARDRDAAILEFMTLTNYNFEFSIYVKLFNSITNVSRLSADDFALVFTSGIRPYESDEASGPTEKFLHNYGPRVHHMAFRTEQIEETFASLKARGMEFLIGLIGSEDEGLKQTFSQASENTLIVNEYIRRYGDFDGFFSPKNVMMLTGSTDKQ
jgi:4-hydroxyphenylpyruvate dioxygenase-like putative hemolysin